MMCIVVKDMLLIRTIAVSPYLSYPDLISLIKQDGRESSYSSSGFERCLKA